MAYIDEIAEFNMQDGFTPWQVRKLNALVRRVASMLPDTHVVEIRSVEQLSPGSDPYVRNAGDPKVALLEFGIPESVAYTLTKSGNRIVLSGNDGSSMSVEDSDTTYSISKAGDTVTLFGSDGTETSFTDKDTNTTYTLSKSGSKIKLTGSDGSVSQVDVVNADTNTTYTISKSGNTVTLTGSDGSTSSFTDKDTNTTYSLSKSGSTIKLTGSDGSESSVTDSNTNTTYTLSKSGNSLKLTPSSGTADTVALSAVAFSGSADDLTDLPTHYNLRAGMIIPANSNLNTFPGAEIGTYYRPNNSDVATLTNCPVTIAFKMWVERSISTNYVLQHLVTWNGLEYWWRQSTDGGSTWNAWYREAPRSTTNATANKFLATPNGSAGLPEYRSIVEGDLIHTYQNSLYSHGVIGSYYDDFDRSRATIPSAVDRRMFVGYDQNGKIIGAVRMYQNTASRFATIIEAVNQDSEGNAIVNQFGVRKERNGADHYFASNLQTFADDFNLPFLGNAEEIPANANLNADEYRTNYATFQCSTSAAAASLSNCPTNIAFKMIVFIDAYVCQIIMDYASNTYFRYYSSGSWNAWRKIVYWTNANSTKNHVLATPNGSAGMASFRALALADLPNSESGNRWGVNAYTDANGITYSGNNIDMFASDGATNRAGRIQANVGSDFYLMSYASDASRYAAVRFFVNSALNQKGQLQVGNINSGGDGWDFRYVKAPVQLYNSTNGATGAITLSQSAANFNYIGIYYCTNNRNYRNYVEVYLPDGKTVNLLATENAQNGQADLAVYIKSKGMLISGTSMTNVDYGGQAIVKNGDTGTYAYAYTYIKILRVVGFM